VPTHKCSNVNLNGLLNFNIFSVIAQLFSDYLRILKDKCAPGLNEHYITLLNLTHLRVYLYNRSYIK
jgi:hypothetical protein